MKKNKLELGIFIPGLLILLVIIAFLIFMPEVASHAIDSVFHFIAFDMGWVYLLIVFAIAVFSVWLCFSKYGSIKLGPPDSKKEYSEFAWGSMMFTAGIGIGITLLSFVEPISLLKYPAFSFIEQMSDIAYEYAHMYDQFLWGPVGWAVYVPGTIAVAYSIYVRQDKTLRLSQSCAPVLKDKTSKGLGRVIDVIALMGTVGGIATSIGLGVPFVSNIANHMWGVPETTKTDCIILLLWLILFGTFLFFGLDNGIKKLSSFNMYLFGFFVVIILLRSPILDILNMEVNSIGLMLDNFFNLCFGTDPVTKSGNPQNWVVFYWAWWVSFIPMMGLFVARISKGRTIREVVAGEILWGAGGCMCTFGLFGGYAFYLQKNGIIDLVSVMESKGRNYVAISIIESLPMGRILMYAFLALVFIFMATTIESTAYILASMTTKQIAGDEEPTRWNRMLWSIIIMLLSLGLMIVGGLQSVQTSSLVAGFPLLAVAIVMMISIVKSGKNFFDKSNKK